MSEASSAVLAAGLDELGLALSQYQQATLLAYAALISKWNGVYNLTAVRDPAAVLTHHLLDSLAVVQPLRRALSAMTAPCDSTAANSLVVRLLDVGAGAGLPGVVIAIACPDIEVTCIDAVAKKMAFVRQVSGELKLRNLHALHERIEKLDGAFDVVTSRAFASLADFYRGSERALSVGGLWMAMKGKRPNDEMAEAQALPVDMFHVEQLRVPGLDADRCIVWAHRR